MLTHHIPNNKESQECIKKIFSIKLIGTNLSYFHNFYKFWLCNLDSVDENLRKLERLSKIHYVHNVATHTQDVIHSTAPR